MTSTDEPAKVHEQARALKQAALHMAIEHHAHASQHRNSRGPARAETVTATASEFYAWLREVADRAGVTDET